jgi:tetratricopeptide (TPR) repeat protein
LKRYNPALAAMEEGLKKFPNDANLLLKKAEIHFGDNRPKEAIECLEKIKDEPEMTGRKYLLLGQSNLALRQMDKAEIALEKAINSSDSALANFLFGKILIRNNKVSRSITYLEKAITKISDETKSVEIKQPEWLYEAHRLLGGAFKETGKNSKAIEHIRKYAELVPPGPLKEEALKLLRDLGAE